MRERVRAKLALATLLLCAGPVSAQRTYWPATVSQIAHGLFKHTHAQVTGIADYTALEADGIIRPDPEHRWWEIHPAEGFIP